MVKLFFKAYKKTDKAYFYKYFFSRGKDAN